MGAPRFDDWTSQRAQYFPLSILKDAVLGVEASHYLDRLLNNIPSKEPLLSALGGWPLALQSHIDSDLDVLQSLNIKPIFVFSGMEITKKDLGVPSSTSSPVIAKAWDLYDQGRAVEAVDTFGSSGSIKPENLYRFLQYILRARGLSFQVAPYHAWAQLSHLLNHPKQYIDAVVAAPNILMFDVDKVITSLDLVNNSFYSVVKATVLEDLGKISNDVFIDACLLAGSAFTPPFPPLQERAAPGKIAGVRDAITLISTFGRSATNVCVHFQDNEMVQQLDYLDRYRRGKMAVRHHVVLTAEGKVEPLEVSQAPSDVHEFIGQRLPSELYYYLSKGVIGARVLNWITSGELVELPPLDNGESAEYHRLVRDQLAPMRTQALALLAQPLSFYYHRKDVRARFWFQDAKANNTLSYKDIAPRPSETIASWNVKSQTLEAQQKKVQRSPGSLAFGILSLADKDFAKQTITARVAENLTTKEEVLSNVIFRFLHLRDYVDESHGLTSWGRVLSAALSNLRPIDRQPQVEEAIFLAIEMIRLGLLNAAIMFPTYASGPRRGSDEDIHNTRLLSRVACFGKLKHKAIGFTGPLSRTLLAYNSMISAVRATLRDLVEVSMVHLLLNGNAVRDRADFPDLGLDLPFGDENDCGLGIAVRSYLEELTLCEDPTSTEAKATAKVKGATELLPHSEDLPEDIDRAFRIWDCIYLGTKEAGKDFKARTEWDKVDKWLAERR